MKVPVDEVTLFGTENFLTIKAPKPVARIILCGAMIFTIMDNMNFNRPTEEQIKNLKECFNIEVELLNEHERL